jgi:catechol 2,3-dioxygenase-like lactoylglutathione lyase family enzyme
MEISGVDHLVLTVESIERTIAFYTGVLDMRAETFGDGRRALHFGSQKFNLHEAGHEFEPKARRPTPGSVDICLVSATPLDEVVDAMRARGVPIVEGPVDRTGAQGAMRSVYVRDPDDNLVEICHY